MKNRPEPALLAFQLACRAESLALWIENAWWDDGMGYERRLFAEVQKTQVLIDQLERQISIPSPKLQLERLSELLDAFIEQFEQELSGQKRAQDLSAIGDADRELEEELFHFQVKNSPLRNPAWHAVAANLDQIQGALPPPLNNCFKLGRYLASKLWPTRAPQPGRPGAREFEVAGYINGVLEDLSDDLPWLGRVKGLPDRLLDETQMFEEIERVEKAVEGALRRPKPKLLYLGIEIDESRMQVRRGRKSVLLPGGVQPRLLRILMNNRGNYVPANELWDAWEECGRDEPTEAAFHKMLSDLRKRIGLVDLRLDSAKNAGWRVIGGRSYPKPE